MRKEAKHLYQKAIDSLTLSIELFNRPSDRGRVHSVLIFMDHAFEMLLKASILERRESIFQDNKAETIGMSACIRRCLSDVKTKILVEEQVLVLQSLNSLRDAAQHYTLNVSEQQLYFHAQSGLTLFRDIAKAVFGIELNTELPERVLPLSTTPPMEIATFFQNEIKVIKSLLKPGSRKVVEAKERLRSLAIFENSVKGMDGQPSEKGLKGMLQSIRDEAPFENIFPSVSVLQFTTKGYGPSLDLRITKADNATPITLVPEGTPGAAIVAIKRVNELDFYSLSLRDLSEKTCVSTSKLLALIKELDLQSSSDYFKRIKIRSSIYKMYSLQALDILKKTLPKIDMDDVWERNKPKRKKLS